MAMTKADLEAHHAEYQKLLMEARSALEAGLHFRAVQIAVSAWKHVDGMMQFARKYEDREFHRLDCVDLVLQYAPLLFDFASLDALESLLCSQRRIDKNTELDLADELERARTAMWDAHAVWDYLERSPVARESEFGNGATQLPSDWHLTLVLQWEDMGLIRRNAGDFSDCLSLSLPMNETVPVKCPSCGGVGKGVKVKLLDQVACPKCGATVLFVILAKRLREEAKE